MCFATLAHADATHIINAGSRAEYTTVDEAVEPPQVPAPLYSQTLHVTLEDDPEDVVRLSRGGGGRAFSQQELEVVRKDPKLPSCTKALIELATASTIPGWHDWTLAVTRNRPCLMQQWRVVDGPAVAPVQRGLEFPNRGITGAQEAAVFRAPSTVKGRLGVQAAYFHVLGFDWQFCCLPVFALVRFGVVVGNPQHGGDAHVIAIDRHGEVIQQQGVAGTLGDALPLLAPLTHREPRMPHRRSPPPAACTVHCRHGAGHTLHDAPSLASRRGRLHALRAVEGRPDSLDLRGQVSGRCVASRTSHREPRMPSPAAAARRAARCLAPLGHARHARTDACLHGALPARRGPHTT